MTKTETRSFLKKQFFFPTQPQCCLNFSWTHRGLHLFHFCMSFPKSIYPTSIPLKPSCKSLFYGLPKICIHYLPFPPNQHFHVLHFLWLCQKLNALPLPFLSPVQPVHSLKAPLSLLFHRICTPYPTSVWYISSFAAWR